MPDKLQAVYTPFSAGIDTQAHPHNIRSPYLRDAVNVDYRRDIGPQKREGMTALPTDILGGGNITNGGQVLAVGDELVCTDDQAVYSWSPSFQRWIARGEMRPVLVQTRAMAVASTQVTSASVASLAGAGIDGCAWVSSSGVHLSVVDTATGTRVMDDLLVATGRSVCRIVAGTSALVVLTMDPSGNVYSSAFLPGQAGMTSEVLLASGVQGASLALWDIAPDTATDGFVFAYLPPGTGKYNLRLLRSDGTPYGVTSTTTERTGVGLDLSLGGSVTLLTVTTDLFDGFSGEAARVVMVSRAQSASGGGFGVEATWAQGIISAPTSEHRSFSSTSSQIQTMSTVQTSSATGAMTCYAVLTVTNPLFVSLVITYQIIAVVIDPSGVTVSVGVNPLTGVRMLSRAFLFGPNKRLVAWCSSATLDLALSVPRQPTAFLMDLTSNTFMAAAATGNLDTATLIGGVHLQQPYLRNGQWATGALIRVRQVSGKVGTPGAVPGSTLVPQSGAFALLATPATGSQLQAVALDSTAIFASGVTYQYDGASVVEQGFFEAPNPYGGGVTNGSGGSLGTGSYQWTAVWEWYDARGKRHRSAPATPITQTVTGTGFTGTLLFTPLRLTRKRNVALVVYRTTANGSVFFQVSDSTAPIINNPSVNLIYVTDGLADSVIIGNEPLYTGGGELPNDAPPASTVALRARSRVLLAGGEYPDTITYSKQNDVGNGVQFSLGLQKRIIAVPGSIVAMAAIDDKVVVFKTQGICAFAGTGVTSAGVAAGQNDDFSDPVILSTDIFCTAPNSVVTASEGVYFKSQKGVYLLDRGLNFSFAGAAASGFNAQSVRSAVVHPTLGHVRFGCAESTALIYHPRKVQPFGDSAPQAGAWTTYTNFSQAGACIWQGRYVMLRPNGSVCLDGITYDDDGLQVGQVLRTGWLTGTAPLQSARFGALAVIGELTSPHALQVDLAISYDSTPVARLVFDTTVSATRTPWGADPAWGVQAAWGGDNVASYTFRCRQIPEEVLTASAVQWTFSDAATGGAILQRGTSLHGYSMLVEPLALLPSLADKQQL